MPSRRLAREAERVHAIAQRRASEAEACCGALRPPITPLAGVVVTRGATVTTAPIDAPDLMWSRAGWGRSSGCGRRCCRGAGGWACVTDVPHDTSASVDEIRGYTTLDDCAEWHGTCSHVRDQRLHPSVLWRRTISRSDAFSSVPRSMR